MNFALEVSARPSQAVVMQQSMTLLRLTAEEMTELLTRTAETNPYLVVRHPRRRSIRGVGTTEALEAMAPQATNSLTAHVQFELADLLSRGGVLARVITGLMEELDPSGWIGADLGEIARRLGTRETLVEATLLLVQQRIAPTGLFARNLRECLRLQLAERGPLSDRMETVLAHLDLLETGGPEALARRSGLDLADVRACLSDLRSLDPKPGAGFDHDATLTREPDARVTLDDGVWTVHFLHAAEPCAEIARFPRCAKSPALCEALRQARLLKHALELRRSATRQVVEALVARQTGYLAQGIDALRPLTMSELAEATGFHTSTVSRVLNGYLLETPQGVVAAKTLCPKSVSRIDRGYCREQVMARIRTLVAGEDPARPLSDVRLARQLVAEGICISRRVVTNYRRACGICPVALRRKPT